MNKTEKLDHKRQLARERQRKHRENAAKGVSIRIPQGGPSRGYREIRNGKSPLAISSQLISRAAQGALSSSFNDYVFRKVDGNFYEILREGIPIFDAAIRRLISLNGTIKIIGDKPDLVKDLEDFCLHVPVNDMQKGIVAFSQNAQNETFEQGFAIPEFIATKKRDDIDRLVVADSKNIFFRRNQEGRSEPWFRSGTPKKSNYTTPNSVMEQIITARYGQTISSNGVNETRLSPGNKLYFSIDNENQDPHGVSLFRSTEFCAQTLVVIQNSMKNVAERYGDPIHHVHYESTSKTKDLSVERQTLEDDFNSVITSKRAGKSADLVTAGNTGSKVTITVIGHDGQVLTFDIPLRHLLEQCISKFNLPAWMLGIYWSTTERMATLEVEMALADAKIRQAAMLPEYMRLFAAFLTLRGRTWKSTTTSLDKPGDWGMIFESPNVRDTVALAQADFLTAQASQMRKYGSAPTVTTPNAATQIPVGAASFELNGMKFNVLTTMDQESVIRSQESGGQPPLSSASLSPLPSVGEGRVRGTDSKSSHKCRCGKSHIASSILNLESDVKELSRPFPWPQLDKLETEYETRLKSDWADLRDKVFSIINLKLPTPEPSSASSAQSADKGSKGFEYSSDQRASILKALRDYLGIYNADDMDSPVKWYYAQSYSAGLIQAVELIGKERPLLDILQNQGIYSELVTNGFQLVKDNATAAIKNEILDQMENLMLQGANPRSVAEKLSGIFDDQNSDWERLARTEMAGAAERAKLDEWEERDINVDNLYKKDEDGNDVIIIPVHPRCRCSSTVKDDGNGNLRAAFAPAPDACALCLSMQEGDKRLKSVGAGFKPAQTNTSHPSDQSYEKMTAALEKIADRPINIKIEQSPLQLALTLDKTPMNYEMEKDPKTGKVKMKQVPGPPA